MPSQKKKSRLDTSIWQFCAFSSACCLDSCSPMSCVVAGRVMARWHLPLWCFWNAAVAFFQLQNLLMIYNIVCNHVQWTIIKINYNSSVTYKGWFHIFLSHFTLYFAEVQSHVYGRIPHHLLCRNAESCIAWTKIPDKNASFFPNECFGKEKDLLAEGG